MKFKNENGIVSYEDKEGIFMQFENMQDISDSMLFDSETLIADYKTERAMVTLEVQGEVRVEYKGEIYTRPSDFPKELIELITKDKYWDCNKNVYVGNNNWFELFYWVDGEYILSEVIDPEKLSTEKLYNLLRKFYDNTKELLEMNVMIKKNVKQYLSRKG